MGGQENMIDDAEIRAMNRLYPDSLIISNLKTPFVANDHLKVFLGG